MNKIAETTKKSLREKVKLSIPESRVFVSDRTGVRHYEKSDFLSGSDISDRSYYSRGN